MERPDDNSKPWFPLAGEVTDGFSKEGEATATCLCGAVQLSFVSLALSWATLALLSYHALTQLSNLANRRSWLLGGLGLQLRRLQEAHRVHVRNQLRRH